MPPTDETTGDSVLTDSERERYASQLALDGWGDSAQARLRAATVFVVGGGALGCAAATYLAAAGVGRLGIVDGARVEMADLHRGGLHLTPDLGANKAESAAAKLGLLNPNVQIDPFPAQINLANADLILDRGDCVLACVDSSAAGAVVNDSCLRTGTPLVVADIEGFEGRLFSMQPGGAACWRCATGDMTVTTRESMESTSSDLDADSGASPTRLIAGVCGPVAGILGSLQALEAIKFVTGIGRPATAQLLLIDGRETHFRVRPVSESPDCVCAH